MRQSLAVLTGKAVLALTKLRGGGSAFPGLVALKIAPNLLQLAFSSIPRGVIFVLGSNGKSTTTHMISEILRAHGLSVFTNPTGANLPQGVASSLLGQVGPRGIIQADIAVLEVDEAFAVELAQILHPRVVLGLNTQIDQLYRFIDTERVGQMMLDAMCLASDAVVSNRDDPFLVTIDRALAGRSRRPPRLAYFGVSPDVVASSPHGLLNAQNFELSETAGPDRSASVEVTAIERGRARLRVGQENLDITLPASGLHYAVDAAAATTVAQAELGDAWSPEVTQSAFATMRPAYGRGEVLPLGNTEVTMVMFKNLASLQLNLDALPPDPGPLMLAIDEGTPDMSWIYDVSFDAVRHVDVVSGDKAWQMALCLTMKGVSLGVVEPDVSKAVATMRRMALAERPQTWIVNYEVTMIARKLIGFGELETRA